MDETTFKNYLKTQSRLFIRTIQAKLVVTDAAKYKINAGEDKNASVDISNFFYYNDSLNAAKQNVVTLLGTNTNLDVRGVLTKDNAIQVKLNPALKPTELAKIGLVLQYSVNGGAYQNVVTESTKFDAQKDPNGNQNGFQDAEANEYMITRVDDKGTGNT